TITDECDMNTFPPEAGCVGHGDVTFQQLLADANPVTGGNRKRGVPFGRGRPDPGEGLRPANNSGEPHHSVRGSHDGTAHVPPLSNALPPGRGPAVPTESFPSLEAANAANIVLPNASRDFGTLSPGMHKFQCLIHPWMRIEVEVRQ